MVSVHPSLLRSCAWNPEITDCCNAQVKVESCLYIDRLSYCFIWSNGRSNFVTCTVCVTTSADDILPRYYLCRTLLCSSDRDHKTQRSAVTKARTDDATVQHVVFYWRCFKKKNTARKRRCLSLLNASCLDSALHTSHPSLFLSHLMWEDETTRLDSCLLCFPFYFATPRIPDCSDFLPWLRNSSGVFDYPAGPFSTYTPSCSLPLCQIVFIHMADFFFLHPAFACQSSASSAPLTDTPVWTSSYQVNFGCAVVDAVSDSCARVHFWVLAITVESGHDGLRRQEMRWWKEKRGCTNWENKKKGTL